MNRKVHISTLFMLTLVVITGLLSLSHWVLA
jgi:hypothetical protein